MEWTEQINDGFWNHPEMATAHTFYIDRREDGSLEVSCSRDAIKWPDGHTWREGNGVEFVIPAESAPQFVVALLAWVGADS